MLGSYVGVYVEKVYDIYIENFELKKTLYWALQTIRDRYWGTILSEKVCGFRVWNKDDSDSDEVGFWEEFGICEFCKSEEWLVLSSY